MNFQYQFWFESPVLNIKWSLFVLSFIQLCLSYLNNFSADILKVSHQHININVVTCIIKGTVINIFTKVNIIQNKKNKRNWKMRRIDIWEKYWTKQNFTPNLEALQKEFAPKNYKVHSFLFFDSLGNYWSISKLLDKTHMLLVLQLITYVANSQILLRDLLIVLQMVDYFQLPVFHIADGHFFILNCLFKFYCCVIW